MNTLRIVGIAATVLGLTAWLEARAEHRRERLRERERIEKTRWEGEGGATPSGPQVSETAPRDTLAG